MTTQETKKQYVHAAAIVTSNRTIADGIFYIQQNFGYSLRPQEFSRIQNVLLKQKVIQTILPKNAPEKKPIPAGEPGFIKLPPAERMVHDMGVPRTQEGVVARIKAVKDELRAGFTDAKAIELYGLIDSLEASGSMLGVEAVGLDVEVKADIVNIRRLARITKRLVQVYGRQRVVEMLDVIDALDSIPV